jgi:hypothetical protein
MAIGKADLRVAEVIECRWDETIMRGREGRQADASWRNGPYGLEAKMGREE